MRGRCSKGSAISPSGRAAQEGCLRPNSSGGSARALVARPRHSERAPSLSTIPAYLSMSAFEQATFCISAVYLLCRNSLGPARSPVRAFWIHVEFGLSVPRSPSLTEHRVSGAT